MASKKRTSSTKNKSYHDADGGRPFWRYLVFFALLGVVVLGWLSVLSFHPTDPPSRLVYPQPRPVGNRVGIVGAHVAYALRYWVGLGIYAALAAGTALAGVWMIGRRVGDLPWRAGGVALLTAAISVMAFLRDPNFNGEVVLGSAGVLGSACGDLLLGKFGPMGSWIIAGLTAGVGSLLAADDLLKILARAIVKFWSKRPAVGQVLSAAGAKLRSLLPRRKSALAVAPAGGAVGAALSPPRPRVEAPGLREQKKPATPPADPAVEEARSQPPAAGPKVQLTPKSDSEPQSAPQDRASARKSQAQRSAAKASRGTPTPTDASLPGLDLLADPETGYGEQAEVQAVQRKLVLQQTLEDFGVEAKVVGYMTGPVITLFEVSLNPGVKVSAVSNLATDIARTLAVPGVRIVPPRFGKDTVGIEVPNLDKETVRLKELMRMHAEANRKMTLPLYLGKDAGGDAIVVDLAKCPHMLIAGTTGSGKSVCINTIIMSLLMTRTPADVRFILVDPKMVEMAAFEKLPHLLCPTINEMKKAEDILEWATVKMDERYELLRQAGVRNLAGYNKLKPEELYECFEAQDDEAKARIPLQLPSYVIIIDELADLMMTSSKEVESYIIRIAQKARAVGIHLVLATQRPSANVVTGLIKSNMPCRVSFRVASGQESRIVLDQKGAEILLGQGDMLLLEPGDSTLTRAQGTYIDDGEIKSVCRHIQDGAEQQFDAELLEISEGGGPGEMISDRDDLFEQAVEVVLQTQRGSVSLLQRRLGIGYGRASRIIDQMDMAGILGEHKGSQARECMITLDDWEAMKSSIAADQSGDSSLDGTPTSA